MRGTCFFPTLLPSDLRSFSGVSRSVFFPLIFAPPLFSLFQERRNDFWIWSRNMLVFPFTREILCSLSWMPIDPYRFFCFRPPPMTRSSVLTTPLCLLGSEHGFTDSLLFVHHDHHKLTPKVLSIASLSPLFFVPLLLF